METKTDNPVTNPNVALAERYLNEFKENSYQIIIHKRLDEKASYELKARDSLNNFKKAYKELNEIEKIAILNRLILDSNAVFIQALERQNPEEFNKIIDLLAETDKEFISSVLLMREKKARYITSIIIQSSVQGRITKLGGLLSCAQIAARKIASETNPYVFDPVILSLKEFEEYLNTLKKNAPCRERFVISGGHWVAGEIRVNSNGMASILFLESLGLDKIVYGSTTEWAIKIFKTVFPTADEKNIYVPKVSRQRDGRSCMMGALNDLEELYRITHYLLERYEGDLFAYFKNNSKGELSRERYWEGSETEEEATANKIKVQACQLPLPFLRRMQDPKEYEEIIKNLPDEEIDLPVNKKGEKITKDGTGLRFFDGDKNYRLDEKLKKMKGDNLKFIKPHSIKSLKEAMFPFTLEGIKQKYLEKTLENFPKKEEVKPFETPLLKIKKEDWRKILYGALNSNDTLDHIKKLESAPILPWLYVDKKNEVSFFRLLSKAAAKESFRNGTLNKLLAALLTKFSNTSEEKQKTIATALSEGRYSSLLGVVLETDPNLLYDLQDVFPNIFPLEAKARKTIIDQTKVLGTLIKDCEWDLVCLVGRISEYAINNVVFAGNTLLMYCLCQAEAMNSFRDKEGEYISEPRYTDDQKKMMYDIAYEGLCNEKVDLTIRNDNGLNIIEIMLTLDNPLSYYENFIIKIVEKIARLPEDVQKEMKKNISPEDYSRFVGAGTPDVVIHTSSPGM